MITMGKKYIGHEKIADNRESDNRRQTGDKTVFSTGMVFDRLL